MYIYIYMHIYIYTYTHACVYSIMYVYVYIYIYIHTYIHTHIGGARVHLAAEGPSRQNWIIMILIMLINSISISINSISITASSISISISRGPRPQPNKFSKLVALEFILVLKDLVAPMAQLVKVRLSDAGGPRFESQTGRVTGESTTSLWRDKHPANKGLQSTMRGDSIRTDYHYYCHIYIYIYIYIYIPQNK